METKQDIRKHFLKKRNLLSPEEISEKSLVIQKRLIDTVAYKKADYLLLYLSFGSEVQTAHLLMQAQKDKKQIFCPRVLGNEMDFYLFGVEDNLIPGPYGILEPTSNDNFSSVFTDSLNNNKNCLMVLPGIAFDHSGGRLGYGKGYYDKYLENKCWIQKAGISFTSQYTCTIDPKPHDISLDFLVLEQETIYFM